jgi:hypothetical protein
MTDDEQGMDAMTNMRDDDDDDDEHSSKRG